MIQWLQDNLAIPLFMGAGAVGMQNYINLNINQI